MFVGNNEENEGTAERNEVVLTYCRIMQHSLNGKL
jgi:hypothetical protein